MYFHGTSDNLNITFKLLPPIITNKLSEKGRNKNLNKVFFTKDINSAKIYSHKAVKQFGGNPIIFRVIPMSEIITINNNPGTSVFCADWAFLEPVENIS